MSQQNEGMQPWMVPVGLGGLLAGVLLRDARLASHIVRKTSLGRATRAPIIGKGMSTFSVPMNYSFRGQLEAAKVAAKHPTASIKALKSDTPLYMSAHKIKDGTTVGDTVLQAWAKQVQKNVGRPIEPLTGKQLELVRSTLNARQPLIRKGFGMETQKSLKGMDDIYVKNKSGNWAFNRSNPKGRKFYDEAAKAVSNKIRKQGPESHSIMGNFGHTKHWNDIDYLYDDVWDLGHNPGDVKDAKVMWEELWRRTVGKKPSLGFGDTDKTTLLSKLAGLESRKILDNHMIPVHLRGVISHKDIKV